MSLFDYPRFNFKGNIELNPGTANNDDYAQLPSALLPPNSGYGKYAGKPLALIESKTVQAQTYGMTDADFIAWAQQAHTFVDAAGKPLPRQIVPAEWNYYGGMESNTVKVTVIGVQTGPGQASGGPPPNDPAAAVNGATVIFRGHITDVNSEGSPPGTQFFIDSLVLGPTATPFLSGSANKGACQWLNFYRNVNLTADGGSGGYVYHVMRKTDPRTIINLPGFEDPKIVGVICRYYLYQRAGGASDPADIVALYQKKAKNPATLEIIGTFAPLYDDEKIFTGPVGRLLVWNGDPQIRTPNEHNNGNKGFIALAPAVLRLAGDTISADFSGTFPDYFQSGSNPKFDFGPVTLVVANATGSADVGPVDYANGDAGDRRGWIFDFDISTNAAAKRIAGDADAHFSLRHAAYGTILEETDYYFVSNQQAIYAEQHGPGDMFLNQGTTEPATVAVYHRGRELAAADCPPITVWQYRSVPIQSPGTVETNATNFKPGQPIQVDTSQPGNFLLTFSIDQSPPGFPPPGYLDYMFPPYLTNAPSISLRILPNDEDFSTYYNDPTAKDPVGNERLTFEVVYQKVLKTYYLLYPIMNKRFALNNETVVTTCAPDILRVTNPAMWMSIHYMPRTRDMSETRRTLLQAWCRKVAAKPAGA